MPKAKKTRAPGAGRPKGDGPPKTTLTVYLPAAVKERLIDRATLERRTLAALCAEHLTALVGDVET